MTLRYAHPSTARQHMRVSRPTGPATVPPGRSTQRSTPEVMKIFFMIGDPHMSDRHTGGARRLSESPIELTPELGRVAAAGRRNPPQMLAPRQSRCRAERRLQHGRRRVRGVPDLASGRLHCHLHPKQKPVERKSGGALTRDPQRLLEQRARDVRDRRASTRARRSARGRLACTHSNRAAASARVPRSRVARPRRRGPACVRRPTYRRGCAAGESSYRIGARPQSRARRTPVLRRTARTRVA